MTHNYRMFVNPGSNFWVIECPINVGHETHKTTDHGREAEINGNTWTQGSGYNPRQT